MRFWNNFDVKKIHYICGGITLVIIILGVGYWYNSAQNSKLVYKTRAESREQVSQKEEITLLLTASDLEAKSALVVDLVDDRVLFEKDSTTPYPLASLSKIVTALVALTYFPLDSVSITRQALSQIGDYGLYVDELWHMRDLVEFMLVVSSNDAAYAIATHIDVSPLSFIQLMNTYVQEQGFHEMYFLDSTGLDDAYGVTGFGTARDVLALMRIATEKFPEIFLMSAEPRDQFISENNIIHTAVNTNVLADKIPGLTFSKTGYTEKTGGNVAFIFEYGPQHPIGVVILGSSYQGRFDDAETIIHSFTY